MKGSWPAFGSSGGGGGSDGGNGGGPRNGSDYNPAESTSVGTVSTVQTVSNAHSLPTSSTPNSVIRNYRDGKLSSERYYGESGEAYLDIDYSDHGNPVTHPNVPHEHDITFDSDGRMHRGRERGI